MMRIINFANRNFKEIIRDPLSIIFAVLLPLFILFIFQQFKIPNDVYKIENFTPGILIFSFSFITMFTATLIAKDRSTSFLIRLGTSPMKPMEYVFGYILSVIPLIIIQNVLFFMVAVFLGLDLNINIIYTIIVSIPISILFIGLGVIIGSFTTEKSASGISSIIVQLVAFTSGMYFSTEMIGTFFATVSNVLPFSSCVNITKGILNKNYEQLLTSSLIVVIYTILIIFLAILIFRKKMISDNK
jgi:ABC-2 type transport system permease protein